MRALRSSLYPIDALSIFYHLTDPPVALMERLLTEVLFGKLSPELWPKMLI